jgi:GDPmannose 4,6-dehydratase
VHGVKRCASPFNTERIDYMYQDPHVNYQDLILHYGNLLDVSNLVRINLECDFDKIKPWEASKNNEPINK